MTALPEPWRLLTIADYLALDEDELVRHELQEGVLAISPSPKPQHNIAGAELYSQVRAQLPPELAVVPDVDIDLQLVPADGPATVRRPDLVVVDRSELVRVKDERDILRASGVAVVVEIVSPGSRRTDFVMKKSEYADAGIPHYWIIDLSEPLSLVAFRLTEELGYVDDGEVTGTFTTSSPCPLIIDLKQLG
ncbi:Uma2 family endonuclease [Nocardia brasiliensis]|uniref:Uma2 family endonuclease n=1 Tax=Nocardia brasiliensis TaxID=37326 RepID=UPI001894ED81|nr:Uma2 family endonuclease [Nocardia brasiliensis]MBF6546070.1 Uma2 family endonuclease [Nocardia brasiliensis]